MTAAEILFTDEPDRHETQYLVVIGGCQTVPNQEMPHPGLLQWCLRCGLPACPAADQRRDRQMEEIAQTIN